MAEPSTSQRGLVGERAIQSCSAVICLRVGGSAAKAEAVVEIVKRMTVTALRIGFMHKLYAETRIFRSAGYPLWNFSLLHR